MVITLLLSHYTIKHYPYGFAQDMYKHDELPEVALMKALDSNTTNHYETISTDTASHSPII